MNCSPRQLLALPDEILEASLIHAAAHDIVSCLKTCKQLYQIITGSSYLQLILELAIEGLRIRGYPSRYMPCGMDTKSAAERLVQLNRWKEAWIGQKSWQKLTSELHFSESDVKDGLYIRVLQMGDTVHTLEAYSLWIEQDQKELKLWRKYDLDVMVYVYSFEPSENLLALVEAEEFIEDDEEYRESRIRVHLKALDNGLPHPRAKMAVLDNVWIRSCNRCSIETCGDIVVLFCTGSFLQGYLFVWNWKTGEELYECHGARGFAYLTPSSIMVARCLSADNMFLELVDLCMGSSGKVMLELPPSRMRIRVTSQHISANSPYLHEDIPLSPFVCDETAERVLVITVDDGNHWDNDIFDVHWFVLVRPLLQLLAKSNAASPSPNQDCFSWEEWNQDTIYSTGSSTRVIPRFTIWGARVGLVFHSPISLIDGGLRTLGPEDLPSYNFIIPFLDFNPRPAIRASSKKMATELDNNLMSQKIVEYVNRELFHNGGSASLPTTVRCLGIFCNGPWPDIVVDTNHIIVGFKYSDRSEVRQLMP
ncbi:hypothetical protein FS842_003406 [Serendipita sp. 407]|nr:hypothetical protein FS842_003406 [Serendipita sp. 407]